MRSIKINIQLYFIINEFSTLVKLWSEDLKNMDRHCLRLVDPFPCMNDLQKDKD